MQPDSELTQLGTEEPNLATHAIDRMSPLEMMQLMHAEDQTVMAAVGQVLPQVAAAVAAISDRLRTGGRLIYLGAGTSGRLGALDAIECPPTFNVSPDQIIGLIAGGSFALDLATEHAEDDPAAGQRDLTARHLVAQDCVVGITASGRTPYVLGGMTYAATCGALRIGLACNAPAPLADLVDIMIAPVVGPEVIAGSTRLKAGTAQKLILNMLSTGVMVRLGKTYGNLMVDVRPANAKLWQRARAIVCQVTGASTAAAEAALHVSAATPDGEPSARVAIVMLARQVDAVAASDLLAAHANDLRTVLEAG